MPLVAATYVVCVPKVGGGSSVSPCVTVGGITQEPKLITSYTIDDATAATIDGIHAANNGVIDYATAGAAWAAAFCLVILSWFFAKQIGLVLSLLKSKH